MKTHTTSLKAKFNSAFSLVELLVVIAVIAVIAAIAIPNIAGINEAAGTAKNQRNAQLIASTYNNSLAAGNPGGTEEVAALATVTGDGYSNAATGIVFRVDGVDDEAAALEFITMTGNQMTYSGTPGS